MIKPIVAVVTGGRDFADEAMVFAALDDLHVGKAVRHVYHGACGVRGRDGWKHPRWREELRGADGLAERWAQARKVSSIAFPAFWDDLGNAAGPIRNGWMLGAAKTGAAIAEAELCVLAFPGGNGTDDCVGQAKLLKVGVIDLREVASECGATHTNDLGDVSRCRRKPGHRGAHSVWGDR